MYFKKIYDMIISRNYHIVVRKLVLIDGMGGHPEDPDREKYSIVISWNKVSMDVNMSKLCVKYYWRVQDSEEIQNIYKHLVFHLFPVVILYP